MSSNTHQATQLMLMSQSKSSLLLVNDSKSSCLANYQSNERSSDLIDMRVQDMTLRHERSRHEDM